VLFGDWTRDAPLSAIDLARWLTDPFLPPGRAGSRAKSRCKPDILLREDQLSQACIVLNRGMWKFGRTLEAKYFVKLAGKLVELYREAHQRGLGVLRSVAEAVFAILTAPKPNRTACEAAQLAHQ
jgi:hypothetical protein